ncbi:MAG: ABC transporter permease [Lachnospiraceae bacterium]|nr:ABC transporter permease [Lachnospiraceae bacterium]MBR3508934.1 ABC transporter permease [Lachnospiraceae bacterium]MBR4607058.1 ABC transporter permease [Lachnospiraceae bacterium]MBR6152059.1 ABC transporter permease [Lachnospiraceae bacterium]
MKHMIRASFYKLFHDKATWIGLVGTAVWSLLVGSMIAWSADAKLDLSDTYALEKYWRDFMAFHAIRIPLLVSASTLFTTEFKDKSWKLLIARGISKTSFFFSKVLCILVLTIMISFVAITTGAAYGTCALGMQTDGAFAGNLFRYFLLQTVAHGTAAILILAISFLIKIGEISSSLNMVLMIFGTMVLSKLEGALSLGDALTGSWAFAQPMLISFTGQSEWIRILIVFAAYLILCSLAVLLVERSRDIE